MNDDAKTGGSVGTELPKEIARVQKLREICLGLPDGAGSFAAAFMERSINAALQAISEADVVGMVRSYADLKEYKE